MQKINEALEIWSREAAEEKKCEDGKDGKINMINEVSLPRKEEQLRMIGAEVHGKYSYPRLLPGPSVWSCLYRVWCFSCMTIGSSLPPGCLERQHDTFDKPQHSSPQKPSGSTLAFNTSTTHIISLFMLLSGIKVGSFPTIVHFS